MISSDPPLAPSGSAGGPVESAGAPPPPPLEARIVPRKTALGSYVIIRRVAVGGMGEVWEGWLIPSAELGGQLLKGEHEDLRKIAGVATLGEDLGPQDREQIQGWMKERTEEFLKHPPQPDEYRQMLDWVSPHRRLGQDYRRAIKILNPDLARNPEVVRRFVREIEFLSRLNHPNIVKVVESGQAGSLHYAAMEFVDAVPVESKKFSIPEMTHVIRQALEGLIHAHEQGVLHRDLKPGNILVKDDLGTVKITDFGIAKALDEAVDGHLTATGVIIGTPFYLDPERARGAPSVEKSDIYSLGATFYRLLTGDPPAKAPSAMDAVALIQSPRDPKWVREVNPHVSEELEDAVMMMLSKDLRYRLTGYEARVLLKYLDENNELLHREATARQRRQDARAARRLAREIQVLRRSLAEEGKAVRVGSIRKLYTLVEDLAELHPRDTEKGVNRRIDAFEEAATFHREVVIPLGDAVLKGVRDRVLLLEKRWALEIRRLARHGFKRRVSQPRRVGRRVLFAVAGLLIVLMAVLFGNQLGHELDARRQLDSLVASAEEALVARDVIKARTELDQARTVASELPRSRIRKLEAVAARIETETRIEQATAQLQAMRAHVGARDYARAAEDLESIRRTVERPVSDRDAAGRIQDVLGRAEREGAVFQRYAGDLKIFAALVRSLDDLERKASAADVSGGDFEACLDSIALKLENPGVVDPQAIGPSFEEARRRTDTLRPKMQELDARLRKR